MIGKQVITIEQWEDVAGRQHYIVVGLVNTVDFDIRQKFTKEQVRDLLTKYEVRIRGEK